MIAQRAHATQAPSLLFRLAGEPYRIELRRLRAVVSWAELRASETPGVLGWLDLHGEAMPVVDVGEMVFGVAAERCLGSRILVMECGVRRVGVLVSAAFRLAGDEDGDAVERFDPCDVLPALLKRIA